MNLIILSWINFRKTYLWKLFNKLNADFQLYLEKYIWYCLLVRLRVASSYVKWRQVLFISKSLICQRHFKQNFICAVFNSFPYKSAINFVFGVYSIYLCVLYLANPFKKNIYLDIFSKHFIRYNFEKISNSSMIYCILRDILDILIIYYVELKNVKKIFSAPFLNFSSEISCLPDKRIKCLVN